MKRSTWVLIVIAVIWFGMRWWDHIKPVGLFTAPPKASTESIKSALGQIRSAISIYYSDTEGVFPRRLEDLTTGGRWLTEVPLLGVDSDGTPVKSFPHPATREALNVATPKTTDSGKWVYEYSDNNAMGTVYVGCTHTDENGHPWSRW